MAGTHYELDRDKRAREQRERPKAKACTRCKAEKPNDFDHFQKKWHGDRHTYETTDVCKACTSARHKENWAKRRAEQEAYKAHKAATEKAAETPLDLTPEERAEAARRALLEGL